MVVISLLIPARKKPSTFLNLGASVRGVHKNRILDKDFELIYPNAMLPKPTFFPAPPDFRAWFEAHRDKFQELFFGFHKKSSGRPSITWPESVQVALCFGWIAGVRKSIDETSYMIRFTPRKPTGTWSAVNIKRVRQLKKMGLMHPAGLNAVASRHVQKTAIYSYEQRKNPQF